MQLRDNNPPPAWAMEEDIDKEKNEGIFAELIWVLDDKNLALVI